jgi:nicotinamidase-related amidase
MRSEASRLVVVDMQQKLLPAIDGGAALLAAVDWLVRVAHRLGVPVAATEEYPQGLGPTVEPLRTLLGPEAIGSKLAFSCVEERCLDALPGAGRPQIVVAGCEAHVCVLQSVLGLAAQGHDVFVVADAVGSRRPEDRRLALERMRDAGVAVVSREMVAFEWLREAGTERFRDVLRDFLRTHGPSDAP